MSLLSQLYDKVVTLTSRLNQIEENAKTNDEFPTQSELVLSSKIRVSNGGVTEVISVEDIILKAVATSQPYLNRFIETTGISSTGLGISINPNWIWMINGIRYTNIVENYFVNYYSDTGFQRIDIIVATESQDFLLIYGEEAEIGVETPVAPVLPINALLVTTILVGHDSMDSPTLPESGYDFLISTDSDNAIVLGSDGKLWSGGGGGGGSTPDATESVKGKAQIATEAEAISGVNDTKIVTPAKLAAAFTDRDLGYPPENVNNKTNTVSGNETSTTLYPSVKGLVDWIASRGFITSVITALGYTPENSANKGAANGYVPLNSSTKIDTTYLPDSILGQLLYGGVVDASTAIATLTNNAKSKLGTGSSAITLTNNTTAITGYTANEGIYYIATVAGTFASISFEVGDWLLSIGSAWVKVDNTDAIASFNTRTGAIVLLNTDVLPLLLSGLSAASGTFTSSDTILTAFGKIKYLIDNIASTYQAILTDVNFGSFSNGLTGKTTPVDADSVNIVDSADSNKAKKVSLTNFKAFLKTYFDGQYSVPCITITTSVSIDTDTTSSGYGQHGRNAKIANSTNAINLTVQTSSNADFVASYTKIGSATITFVAGSGATLVQLSGTAAMTGSAGSTACLTRNGNTYYLQITNY